MQAVESQIPDRKRKQDAQILAKELEVRGGEFHSFKSTSA
jgi:hypothetical protein